MSNQITIPGVIHVASVSLRVYAVNQIPTLTQIQTRVKTAETTRFAILSTGCGRDDNLPDFKGIKTARGDRGNL